MANTSPAHKEKKSQKRKERQERKRERDLRKRSREINLRDDRKDVDCPQGKPGNRQPNKAKTLPGYLAKNAKSIHDWLREFQKLFVKVDDAQIGFLDGIPREERDRLVQQYVDVGMFLIQLEKIMEGRESPGTVDQRPGDETQKPESGDCENESKP